MLERYEPSGKGRFFTGAQGARVSLIGEYDEADIMRRIFTGICSTWGLDDYSPQGEDPDVIRATIILGLSGHFWVGQQFEALNVTFALVNVSRGFTHQAVRARFMAFGQEGTRDTNQEEFDVSVPETIRNNEFLYSWYCQIVKNARDFIKAAHEVGIPFQDASYITTKGLLTDITIHTNFRALQEMMSARLSNTMHWEINHVAKLMRDVFRARFPTFGLWLAPRCELTGVCQSSATLFPPCGKFPLRKGQSDEVNRFGVPYMHKREDNPTSADPSVIREEYGDAQHDNAVRNSLIQWALDVFKDSGKKGLYDAGTQSV